MKKDTDFVHVFVPGNEITLLLLHGTGGDESSLLSIGHELHPQAALLSVRGNVLESGMPRFFRRFSEGVFDEEDIRFRTKELGDFIKAASKEYNFDTKKLVAVGVSNGANIAAGIFFLEPDLLERAVLFRAMYPLDPIRKPDLSGKSILMAQGTHDHMISKEHAMKLAAVFKEYGADVDLRWIDSGHSLTQEDISHAKKWISKEFP